jgi:cell wall-associated NlpC family hydrolase
VRPHRRILKFRSARTEPSTMVRGGWPRRGRPITRALLGATVLLLLLSEPAALAEAASTTDVDVTAGEYGSGPGPIAPIETSEGRGPSISWSDLDSTDAWARTAINYVGGSHSWMRDFPAEPDGTYPFRPDKLETRKYFARAVVKAFAPKEAVDPSIGFSDLEPTQTFYRWANVAVKLGWMRTSGGDAFMPDQAVTMTTVHRVLVLALGMRKTAKDLDRLHTRDGSAFKTPVNFGTVLLGMRLGLRFNSDRNESQDVGPSSPMPRSQVAYSIYKAKTLPTWMVPWVADQYDGIVLPNMGPSRRSIVRWGVRYVGYPYVWGGEWGLSSPEPSALGGQPIAGFDCSGWAWWDLRANDGGSWKVAPPRPYRGWPLAQRTSASMATYGSLKFDKLMPGDLAFYDGNDDGTVDHVDVYIGNGYALDSSHTPGGVTIMWVGDGWYRDHFVHGRRILPS